MSLEEPDSKLLSADTCNSPVTYDVQNPLPKNAPTLEEMLSIPGLTEEVKEMIIADSRGLY